jgi:hypothetical protein
LRHESHLSLGIKKLQPTGLQLKVTYAIDRDLDYRSLLQTTLFSSRMRLRLDELTLRLRSSLGFS